MGQDEPEYFLINLGSQVLPSVNKSRGKALSVDDLTDKDICKYLMKNMVFFQKPNGDYELMEIRQARKIYLKELDAGMVKKIGRINELLNTGTYVLQQQLLNQSTRSYMESTTRNHS